ncbi:MAG TPA: tetratricopeptide repeat protein [Burkholderiaceae bacterium]|nr:tetratricopeptide repeat protein [Burkholderiaceae bacterium]
MIKSFKLPILLCLLSAQTCLHASYDSGLLAYRAGNYAVAYKDLSANAETGNPDAQQLLGHMYYMGVGVSQDLARALEWHRKAANQGQIESQYVLGTMYFSGKGVAQDYREAMRWLQKAGSHGHIDAQYMLGAMYFTGKGVPQDYQRSIAWFRQSAEKGHAEAQRQLGLMHLYGVGGVSKDNVIAYMLWNLATASGNAEAQELRGALGKQLNQQQIEEAQALSSNWQVNTPLPTKSTNGE